MPIESKEKNYFELQARKLQIRSGSTKPNCRRQAYESHSAYSNLTLRCIPFAFNIILNYYIKEKIVVLNVSILSCVTK